MDWNVEWNNGMDLYYHIATYKCSDIYGRTTNCSDKIVLTLFHVLLLLSSFLNKQLTDK